MKDLRKKIGQMIITGFPASSITPELNELICDYKIGNIILFRYNLVTVEQIRNLTNELHNKIELNTGYPAFISIDQEGGVVTRLPDEVCNIPGAMLIAATGNPNYAYEAGYITGKELQSLGINVNFAPVLDVNSNPNNPVIGVRSYSSDANIVKDYGINMMKGLQSAGVMSVIKHFPGHGDTSVDSHIGLPVIEKNLENLLQNELVPFAHAINEGATSVMTSHILFPKIDNNNNPATMSKVILTDILRKQLGFEGIIITDCLEMAAIQNYYGTAQGAVEAIKAGAQMLCICHTPAKVKASIECIVSAVEQGEIPIEYIDKAVENIMKYKQLYQVKKNHEIYMNKDNSGYKDYITKITQDGITFLQSKELPPITKDSVIIGSYANRVNLASDGINNKLHFAKYLAGKMGCNYYDVPINPNEEEIAHILMETAANPVIIYGIYNGMVNRGQIKLANSLAKAHSNTIVVSLREPYDLSYLDDSILKLAAYEYNQCVFDCLVKVFNKEVRSVGVLPVEI